MNAGMSQYPCFTILWGTSMAIGIFAGQFDLLESVLNIYYVPLVSTM